jgi:hypothetical protein
MELVGAVSKRKLASIHVIGMEQYPFENVLGREIGAGFKQFHESQDVVFHPSTSVKTIRKEQSGDETLTKVELSTGETLVADLVIMGVGVRPATDYLKASGWELEKTGVSRWMNCCECQVIRMCMPSATLLHILNSPWAHIDALNTGMCARAFCKPFCPNRDDPGI